MNGLMRSLMADESGQDLVEYVLLLALVALAVFAGLELLGGAVGSGVNKAGSEMQSATP